jgi:hypothetical protein
MEQNKTGKYLKYAIGEIVLVVIGILIALSINNWNTSIQDKEVEKNILENLQSEFYINLNMLKASITNFRFSMEHKIALLQLIGKDGRTINNINIDSLLNYSFPNIMYKPTNAVFEDVIQSGRLKLITSNKMRQSLLRIEQAHKQIMAREEKLDKWTFENELPFMSKHISIKQMDIYAKYKWSGKSNLSVNYTPVFQLLEFENLLDNSIYLQQKMIEVLVASEKEIVMAIEYSKN